MKMRKFAINTLKKLRKDQEFRDSSVREFHVPELNFEATSLLYLIDWSGKTSPLFEPILTCTVPTRNLDKYLDEQFPKPDVPCHTQSCERAVKVYLIILLHLI